MIRGVSRVERWQDKLVAESVPSDIRSSMGEQALAATDAAMVASRSARDRLERWHGRQSLRICLIAALGIAGVAVLCGLVVLPQLDRTTTMTLGLVAALAALGAMMGLTAEAWPKHRASEDVAAAIAGDFVIADQARLLA